VAPLEFHQVLPTIWVWHAYDSSVKADLFSTGLLVQAGLYMIDPIRLPDEQLAALTKCGPVAGIIVTNANHHRAAVGSSERFSVPIFAHGRAFPDPKPGRLREVNDDAAIGDLEVIEIEGAVAGEIALYHPSNGGTLVVGDALINFEPYGFTFLPRKYCENEKQMRSSLRQLLAKPAERLFFSHGTPILSGATARLRQLFEAK
jgi:hypothetical protein